MKTKTKVGPPPAKLSDLMRLALDDLCKVEKSKKYVVNMFVWFVPAGANDPDWVIMDTDRAKCNVCFAGAVMAQTHGVTKVTSSDDFPKKWEMAFEALNNVREGYVGLALSQLRQPRSDMNRIRDVEDYDTSPKNWRRDMNRIVRDLRKVNL